MNYRLLLASFAAMAALVVVLVPSRFAHAEKSYYLSDFNATYEVQASSDVHVTEEITFDFTEDFTWAERFIPSRKVDAITNVRVVNEQGVEPRHLEVNHRGLNTHIRWEYEAQDEERTWTIRYVVEGGLSYLRDRDELYWNITGEEWPVSIRNVDATVILPESASLTEDDLQYRVRYNDGEVTNPLAQTTTNTIFAFSADRLSAHNGLTLVANWPKGVTERPARQHVKTFWLALLGTVAGVLIGSCGAFFVWRHYGKERRALHAIVAQYEAPSNVPVDVAHTLLGAKSHKDTSIAALVVQLANKGYVRIEQLGEPESGVMKALKKLSSSPMYVLHRAQPDATTLDKTELSTLQSECLEALFVDGEPLNMPTKEPRAKLRSFVQGYGSDAAKWLKEHGFIEAASERLRLLFVALALIGIAGGAIVAFMLTQLVHVAFAVVGGGMVVLGVVLFVFGALMRRWTEEGLLAKEYLLGLKDYLHTAERFRLEDVEPEQFTKLLPWAIALGVQKQWEERFADINVPAPSWYAGGAFGASSLVSSSVAAASVGSFASDFSSFAASAGSFSSGLTGGTGTGGGSGGGGGGGGGGAG